jgi:hypothetical protein
LSWDFWDFAMHAASFLTRIFGILGWDFWDFAAHAASFLTRNFGVLGWDFWDFLKCILLRKMKKQKPQREFSHCGFYYVIKVFSASDLARNLKILA